jgi:hypothetical protein
MNINFIKLLKYGARNGDLDIMQKILNIPSNIFSLSTIVDIFKNACDFAHLNVIQWLYEIRPYINISANNKYAFTHACGRGNLVMAQWLYQIKPEIDISACNDEAFRWSCKNGHVKMVI